MALYHTNVLDPQIKALPTVSTASGSIATFDTDMTENLVEVKCQIVAIQEGSGTPSPSNPRPIGVYDSLTLYHNDINMWDEIWELGAISDSDGQNAVNNNYGRSKNYIPVKPNMSLFLVLPTGLSLPTIYFYGVDKSYKGRTITNPFTIASDVAYMRFRIPNWTSYNNDCSVNYPSTDTQYHPFNGVYIPFGQTVANGVLDVTTGKLRVTWGIIEFNGGTSEGWIKHSIVDNLFYFDNAFLGFTDNNIDNFQICNIGTQKPYLQITQITNGQFVYGMVSSVRRFAFKNTDYTEVNDFKMWLSNNPMKVCYKLETPIEIQLDSNQVQALLNENNIWCDTGDTEVEYLLTVGKKIT